MQLKKATYSFSPIFVGFSFMFFRWILGALLFMFRLVSGKGAACEGPGHNGASAGEEQLHNVQRLNTKPGNTSQE